MLFVSNVFVLINYFSQILWFSVAASLAGMLWLRHKEPEMARPIRVNTAIPVLFICCCMFLVLFPIASEPWNAVIGLAITLSGIPVYYLFVTKKNSHDKNSCGMKITIFLQKALDLTCPEIEQKLQSD